MQKSRAILASVGSSKWIKWELAESIRLGFEKKTLFMFPRGAAGSGNRLKEQADRIESLRSVYLPNDSPDYHVVIPKDWLLVQVNASVNTFLLTSRLPGSNSLVLAVAVGHYLLRKDLQSYKSAQP